MEKVVAFTNLTGREATTDCPVLDVDGPAMQLKLPKHVAVGSAVKVETNETLSLGEVSYCRPVGDSYIVWVDLCQALHNVSELTRLAHGLAGTKLHRL